MVAVPLLFGRLTAADYEDEVAQDKRIDALREKIVCYEDPALPPTITTRKNVLSAMRSPWSLLMAHALARLSWSIRLVMRVAAPTVFEAYRKFKINLARQFPTRQQQRILDVSWTEPAWSRCRLTNTSIYMSSEPASSKA